MNPRSRISEFAETRLLNFAGTGNGTGAGGQPDGAEEPAADTPAGKKWAKLREERAAAENLAREEREKRIAAEARAGAIEEFKQMLQNSPNQPAKPGKKDKPSDDDEPVVVAEEDEKVINAVLKKAGLSGLPEALEAIKQSTQQSQILNAVDKAKAELTAEFAGSVPFDYDKALQYAKEKGFGMVASTVKDALRMAHKEMNEQNFINFWKGGPTKKKTAPAMGASGSHGAADDDIINLDGGDEPVLDANINSMDDARAAAMKIAMEGIDE